MSMTKLTVITWASDPMANEKLNTERWAKIVEMQSAGKTDGWYTESAPNTYQRDWLDEATAQEYIDFMMTLDAKYGPGLIASATIIDYVPPV